MNTFTRFTIGERYKRSDIHDVLDVPLDKRDGDWNTGYTKYNGEFFVFSNLGVAGRTGHDYENFIDGDSFHWQAKNGSRLGTPQILDLLSGESPVHIFTRARDRSPFTYQGVASVIDAQNTTPVKVHWQLERHFVPVLVREDVLRTLHRFGFETTEERKYSIETERNGLIIYVKQNGHLPCVIDPQFSKKLKKLKSVPGCVRPKADSEFYHNSSLSRFPKRRHTGRTEIQYGLDFGFQTQKAFSEFIEVLSGEASNDERLDPFIPNPAPDPKTETEAVRAARLGQNKFRDALLDRWDGKCALTGLSMPEILRASHIKPWRDSSNIERLDVDNGILLCVHIDLLFDQHLISFDDEGNTLISNLLDPDVITSFKLNVYPKITSLSDGNKKYLALHRSRFSAANEVSG